MKYASKFSRQPSEVTAGGSSTERNSRRQQPRRQHQQAARMNNSNPTAAAAVGTASDGQRWFQTESGSDEQDAIPQQDAMSRASSHGSDSAAWLCHLKKEATAKAAAATAEREAVDSDEDEFLR